MLGQFEVGTGAKGILLDVAFIAFLGAERLSSSEGLDQIGFVRRFRLA